MFWKKNIKRKILLRFLVYFSPKKNRTFFSIQQMKPRYLSILFVVIGIMAYYYFLMNVQQHASIVFINGNVYTCNDKQPTAEAIAISGNNIIGVGTNEYILKHYRTNDTLDLQGKTIVPGLIDAHAHILGLGNALQILNLVGTTSAEQVADIVQKKISETESDWIFGRGWDQNDWSEKSFPSHHILDEVSGKKFVVLTRIDGHAIWVNNNVLELSGISKSTVIPEGGNIVKDENGNPTGVFIDNAINLVEKIIPEKSDDEIQNTILLAVNECVKLGLTEVHDMGVDLKVLKAYESLIKNDALPLRIYAAISHPQDSLNNEQKEMWDSFFYYGPLINYHDRLTVRAIKIYADGALGSRGAALIESYSDDKTNRGLTMLSEKNIEEICSTALQKGFQVCTHAIGDRGNHIVLNAYENVLKNYKGNPPRFRIEHAQVLEPSDIPRFRKLKVIPSMQPTHATSDMYWAEERLGSERVKFAYAWRSILNTKMLIAGGSDFPVESPNPILGFFAACTRAAQNNYPENGWYGSQKMTRDEALKAFTFWAADAAFEEDWKGTIEGGKVADFTILSKDIMRVPQKEILDAEVEMTIVGGKVVYRKNSITQTN
ncbi:MAG: amidohydrolase [Ignavibacteria bacterium]|nr:amidohydrolase [Ignavibacteria bacterium]